MPVEAGATEEPERVLPTPAQPAMDEPPSVCSEPVVPVASQEPPIDDSAIAGASPRPPSAMDRLALESARPSSSPRLHLAWLASLAVLAFLCGAAYAWRAEIITAWPPSARMYALFGVQSPANQ
jgi:hypothetical protein